MGEDVNSLVLGDETLVDFFRGSDRAGGFRWGHDGDDTVVDGSRGDVLDEVLGSLHFYYFQHSHLPGSYQHLCFLMNLFSFLLLLLIVRLLLQVTLAQLILPVFINLTILPVGYVITASMIQLLLILQSSDLTISLLSQLLLFQ